MELVAEILFDVYAELMFLIVPEKKRGQHYVLISKIIAVFVFLGVIALAIWGAVLITDYDNLWGIAPIAAAVIISLTQIIVGLLLFKKNH